MIYDLTYTVNENTPLYPGDPKVIVEPAGVVAKDGFCDHKLTFGSHTGTHVDVPAHMIEGGKELKDYPIERFVLSAICIDARQGFDANQIVEKAETGDAVLFYTGTSDYFYDAKYYENYPVLDQATSQALIDKQVGMVGLDTGSADSERHFPVHKALLGADILILENVANLKDLVGKRFKLHALPIKLEKDGAPIRAVAEL